MTSVVQPIRTPNTRMTLAATPPLRAVCGLFASFHAAGIPYCHWKSNEHLDRSMIGLTDLDVLVDREWAGTIEGTLARAGFKRFAATSWRSYPGIEDYLTLDEDTGGLVHLHLHHRLTLGEPFLKGYRLPWEPLLLSTRRMDAEHGIYVADPNLEFLLLMVRGALKLRWRGALRPRPADTFRAEFRWLQERVVPQQVLDLGTELLGNRAVEPLRALLAEDGPSRSLLLALRHAAAPSLRLHRTYGPLAAQVHAKRREFAALRAGFERTLLGAIARPTRRTSPRGGLMVAILGPDGAGKSSVVQDVVGSLGRKIDVLPVYFGSGDGQSSALRLPLRLTLKLLRRVRPRPIPTRRDEADAERTPSRHLERGWWRTLATVIWALALSHEKRGKLRGAIRARDLGMIVVCDRLPQNQVLGFNDGPLLARWAAHRAWLPRALARWEAAAYERCAAHPPDLVVKLRVSPEVAAARKHGMSLWEVRRRVEAIRQLRFPPAVEVVEVDADAPLAAVCLAVKRAIWRAG